MNLPSLVTNNDMNSKTISKKCLTDTQKNLCRAIPLLELLNNDEKSKKKSNKLGVVQNAYFFAKKYVVPNHYKSNINFKKIVSYSYLYCSHILSYVLFK